MTEEYILTRDVINGHNERMENIKKYTRNENHIIKLLLKRSREEVVLALDKNEINIKEVDIERIAIENLIFKFFILF